MSADRLLEQAVKTAHHSGLSRAQITAVVERAFGVRRVNGYEVVAGWAMPECPPEIAGARLMVEPHGLDGYSIYWWHSDWIGYPRWTASGAAAHQSDPLVDPDANDPECLKAYHLLGFLT